MQNNCKLIISVVIKNVCKVGEIYCKMIEKHCIYVAKLLWITCEMIGNNCKTVAKSIAKWWKAIWK